MIDPALFLQWIAAMGAIIVTPGPDSLLIMRNAANSGRRVGFATLAGVQAGLVFHTILALFGLSALVATRPSIIMIVGILGALFIAYLAWQTWTAGFIGGKLQGHRQTTSPIAFRDAFFTNALNPKVILAYIAIMFSLMSHVRTNGTVSGPCVVEGLWPSQRRRSEDATQTLHYQISHAEGGRHGPRYQACHTQALLI